MHRDKGNTADTQKFGRQYSSIPKGVGTNGTSMRCRTQATELAEVQAKAHNGCKRNVSNSAYSAVNKIVPNERAERRRWVSYVTDPTETRARLNDVRFQSKERSIYDPLSKKLLLKYMTI
jgi:hypothetical protein